MTSCVTPIILGSTAQAKWNLMNGLHSDGSPWTDPNSNTTQFAYSGNPNNSSEWSEFSTGGPVGDARGISSHNYGAFNSGDTVKQSYAIIYARNGDHLDNVQNIINISADIKYFYDQESDVACNGATWNVSENTLTEIEIYPNPSFGNFNVSNPEGEALEIVLLDLSGKVLSKLKPTNESSIAVNMTEQSSGIYFMQVNSDEGSTVQKIVIE